MQVQLELRQGVAFQTDATEVLYGGAAGGGMGVYSPIMVNIYGLVDPRSGEVRYVGRTKQGLGLRLQQHIDNGREKFKHPRAEWVRALFAEGMRPLITHLETAEDAEQVTAEAKWMERFAGLVNSGTAAQGGTRSYVIEWTAELDAQLGVVADSVIAEKIVVTRKAVTYRRKVLGIPASFNRSRNTKPPAMGGYNRITLPKWVIDLFGSMPDYLLAEKAGVSKKKIMVERNKRGIASYASRTGNSGKFQPGSYPMRWIGHASST